MNLIINNMILKQFRDTIYFVSQNGDVYSTYSKKFIKPLLRNANGKIYAYIDIYDSEAKKQKHFSIHKIVWITWIGEIANGEQINHKNNNSLDNRLCNLYLGSQQQNITDCINNNHKDANIFYLTIYDKFTNKILTFCPAIEFAKYCGHSSANGSVNKFFNKNWFKQRYEILEFKNINNLLDYKSVTTMADECKPVE